jgi:hypothetical protein
VSRHIATSAASETRTGVTLAENRARQVDGDDAPLLADIGFVRGVVYVDRLQGRAFPG